MRPFIALLLLPLAAVAQDMPLGTFTKPGEGWVRPERVEGIDYVDALILRQSGGKVEADFTFRSGGDRYSLKYQDDTSLLDRPRKAPSGIVTAVTRTADKSTVYVAFDSDDAVWAYIPDKTGGLVNGAPYAPLRVRKGYDNSLEARRSLKLRPPALAVNELITDPAGRLYAATEQDIEVFDTTGRLSGVLALPEKGKVVGMAWEGKEKKTLAMWIGKQKWTREMRP